MSQLQKGWVTDKDKWEKCLRTVSGMNWHSLKLVRQQRHNVPKESGVYLVCSNVPSIAGIELSPPFKEFKNTLYIGMSTNLRNRFSQYVTGRDPKLTPSRAAFGELDFLYAVINQTVEEIRDFEDLLVDTFGPTVNKIRPRLKQQDPFKGHIGEGVPVTGRVKK